MEFCPEQRLPLPRPRGVQESGSLRRRRQGLGQVGFRPVSTCFSARQGPPRHPAQSSASPTPSPTPAPVATAVCTHRVPLLGNRPWLLEASSAKGRGLSSGMKLAPPTPTLPVRPLTLPGGRPQDGFPGSSCTGERAPLGRPEPSWERRSLLAR